MRPQLTVRHGSSAWLLYVGAALYVLTFIVLYPRTFAIVDEDAYLTQTFLFRAGRLSYEGSGIPAPHMTVETAGRAVSKYPPGNALFLLPFTLFGWRAVFVSGLLLALAGTCLFRLILRRLAPEADPAWSLLYLFYPAVVLFSRTIMSDLLAATLVLAAFYCLLRSGAGARMSADAHGRARMALVSGLVLGLACLVRYSNAVFVPVFLALLAGVARTNTDEHGRIRRAMLLFVAGFAPPAGLILAYNAYAYGAPFSFPMYLTGHFSPAYFFHNAWYYGTCLLMLYPLMLVAPLGAGKGLRLLLGLPAGVLLVLYCFFSYTYDVPDLPARLTIGIRYLLPALPFFVLAFVVTADRLTRRLRGLGWLKYAALATMALLSLAIQSRHDRYLAVQAKYQRLLLDNLPGDGLLLCNKDVSELVSYAWGWREYRHLSEFNVPVRLDSALAGNRPLYAAMAARPGQENMVELTLFETLLARFPSRVPLVETVSPWRFRLYRLR
jgi:4-amino-4-deoxy-L-arabinose transferase-like glycosyltransferase